MTTSPVWTWGSMVDVTGQFAWGPSELVPSTQTGISMCFLSKKKTKVGLHEHVALAAESTGLFVFYGVFDFLFQKPIPSPRSVILTK